MKVVRILLLLLSAVCGLSLYAAQSDLDRLDGYVARRAEYVARKQHSIDRIKAQLRPSMTADERLAIYDRLFEAYYTFRFDSAMVYVKRGSQLAESAHNSYFQDNFRIQQGLLLATSGYYSQGEAVLQSIRPEGLPSELQFKYYYFVW